ncbi:hypothetical protein Tco_0355800 [Tanacetum coccineum]
MSCCGGGVNRMVGGMGLGGGDAVGVDVLVRVGVGGRGGKVLGSVVGRVVRVKPVLRWEGWGKGERGHDGMGELTGWGQGEWEWGWCGAVGYGWSEQRVAGGLWVRDGREGWGGRGARKWGGGGRGGMGGGDGLSADG